MMAVSYLEILKLAAPETILAVAAFLVLAVDLLVMRQEPVRSRFIIGVALASFACLGATFWMFSAGEHGQLANGILVVDLLTQWVKAALLLLTVFTLVISMESTFTDHVGEYLALILMATVGMMFLVSSEDLLMIFVSLELTSLSLYILAAFNKRSLKSAEAALKYFLFGGMAAAFTLYGLSLVYGLSGSTHLKEIAEALKGQAMEPMLIAAIVLTVIGFGFKVAAVPFHLWAPDAYEGAPTPSAAFIASGSKVASFFVLAKIMMLGFAGAEGSGAWHGFAPGWVPVLALLAAFSMTLGNLAAIAQTSVKRLLAYSAIAHAGYALLGVLANNQQGVASLIYYTVTYALTTLGAFGVVTVVEAAAGGDRLSDFAGLSKRAPVLSLCMMIFMLSLAGIPPLAGFFGKFYVFVSAVGADAGNLGLLWLVILAIAMSAVSLYYYLQVLKQIYVTEAPASARPIKVPLSSAIVIALLALGVVALGAAPDLLVGRVWEAIKLAAL